MRLLKNWVAVTAGFGIYLLGSLMYLIGAFHCITFVPGELTPWEIFVYKTARSPGKKLAPHFKAVGKFLAEHGFERSNIPMAGIYYDDLTKADIPRHAVGFLINQNDTASLNLWESLKQDNNEAKEWSVLAMQGTTTIVSHFPIRFNPNRFFATLSYGVMVSKTYSAYYKSDFEEMKSGSMGIYRSGIVDFHFPQENFHIFNPQESDTFLVADENNVRKNKNINLG